MKEKNKNKIIPIKLKILSAVVFAFILLSILLSYVSYYKAGIMLKNKTYQYFSEVLKTKSKWINEIFKSQKNDLILLSNNPSVIDAAKSFKLLFKNEEDQDQFFENLRKIFIDKKEINDVTLNTYTYYMKNFSQFTKKYTDLKGYANFILIDTESGYIYFESAIKDDFGTSLFKDKYKDSPLATIFHKAKKLKKGDVLFSDFVFYKPYGDNAISFFATPIFFGGKVYSVLILSTGLTPIKNILLQDLKDQSKIYIVGKDHLLRVGTVFKKEDILKKKIDLTAIDYALNDKTGITIETNKNGEKSFIVYTPIKNVFEKRWALVSEIPLGAVLKDANTLRNNILLAMAIFIVIFLAGIYIYVSRIIHPISLLTKKVLKIVNKELPLDTDMTIKTGDEIELLSESFNKFTHILKEDIDIINKITTILKNEAENLNKIVTKEKDIVNTQASSITELASAIEEFSKTMEQITEINKKALKESKELKESALKNRDTQEKVIEGMTNLKREMEETFILFSNIIKLNEDIRGIADIIDNITDQIKIIAFNASLEAAHAGEKGKGFSVIAEQIRELLGHIARQNVSIKKLIDENSENITKISKSSEKLAYFLDHEEENIQKVNKFINNVFELLEKNEEFVKSISFSQNEQKIAIEEFVTSIKESKGKIQKAKELAEAISESVSVLKEMVDELNKAKNKMLE